MEKRSRLLDRYLALECLMMAADDDGNEATGDVYRDRLDKIWYRLGKKDRDYLNARGNLDGKAK